MDLSVFDVEGVKKLPLSPLKDYKSNTCVVQGTIPTSCLPLRKVLGTTKTKRCL